MNLKAARFSGLMKKVNNSNVNINKCCFIRNRRLYGYISINNKNNCSKWVKPKTISEQIKELKSKKSVIKYEENSSIITLQPIATTEILEANFRKKIRVYM